ncbi:hypothetical protein [Massilia sp.]
MGDSFTMHITKKNYFRVEKLFSLSEFINNGVTGVTECIDP